MSIASGLKSMQQIAKIIDRTTGYRDKSLAAQVDALIDADFYRRHYPDVEAARANPSEHFLEVGWAEGRNPCSLFDTNWYFEKYPDVVAAGLNPLVHYLARGATEARAPHPLFDTRWYLDQNEDVRAAGLNPLFHYLSGGWQEARNPNPLFDVRWYAQTHAIAEGVEPLGHYIEKGASIGLRPAALFDGKWYMEQNADVAAAKLNPLAHYLGQGWREGRAPDALFDSRWYAKTYLQNGAGAVDPLADYLTRGEQSGTNPNPWFDARWYLENYPDVAKAGLSAFQHFLAVGAKERRRAGPKFHTDFYVSHYPEAGAPGINPLRHFLGYGRSKGFAPKAENPSATEPSAPQEPSVQGRPPARLQINPKAGETIKAPRDAVGFAQYPPLRHGDGRRFAMMRLGRDHLWYDDARTERFLGSLDASPILPGVRRLLVLGHDFRMKTGVMRSLAHYLNALQHTGGIELTSLELAQGADALVATHDVETHDFVIVNSLPLFFNQANGIQLLRKAGPSKCAIYLHETDFVFDRLEREMPAEYAAFAAAAGAFNFLTVSQRQEEMLAQRFGATKTWRVSETSPLVPGEMPDKMAEAGDRPLTIVMAGTLQPRKGVTLFSEAADLAKAAGLPWHFVWAGGEVGQSEGLYRSANVDFLGNLVAADMEQLLRRADIFFLASVDDPFPLACLEALQMRKRCVVFRETGTAEVIGGIDGCAVYDAHTALAAFAALKKAVTRQLDVAAVEDLNARYSLGGFAAAMRDAIGAIMAHTPEPANIAPVAERPRVAAIVHLFYHDLWPEIAGHLENLRHLDVDLYVTLTDEKDPDDLAAMRARILRRWPKAEILVIANQGMDVGPFVEVVRSIKAAGHHYDLVLKLHSKKSVEASGMAEGRAWRQRMLRRIVGSPTDVDRILSIFADHPEVGMIGPSTFVLEKSSRDLEAGIDRNASNMALLADRMGLSDRTQRFIRGTMFWARADDIFRPILTGNITINDFKPGYQPDLSQGHAMERMFACMTRSAGRSLVEYNPLLPKSIRLLKDRHKGEDIYVIAAGASAGHIDPDFFDGKTTIGVNRVFVRFRCNYVVLKEFANAEYDRELAQSGAAPVIARWDAGGIRQGKMRPNIMSFRNPRCYFFDHLENKREQIDVSLIGADDDRLVVSYSTITSAIHLAAYMGAKNVILVGHDCGTLDGESVFPGYYKSMEVSPWTNSQQYAEWLIRIEDQTLAVKSKLAESSGTRVLSINPFVNFGLEGRHYDRMGRIGSDYVKNRDRPVLILCNGPSAQNMRVPHDLEQHAIARMNFFFLENEVFADGRVDHLFWTINNKVYHDELREVIRSGKYRIASYNNPIPISSLNYTKGPVAADPFCSQTVYRNCWEPISMYSRLAWFIMKRPLPTTGLQAIAALAGQGHRKFAISGMDFYQQSDRRYHFEIPDHIKKVIAPVHHTPGYEKGAHDLETDFRFLEAIVKEFVDIEFALLSDMPVLEQRLEAMGARFEKY